MSNSIFPTLDERNTKMSPYKNFSHVTKEIEHTRNQRTRFHQENERFSGREYECYVSVHGATEPSDYASG